jgi:hypothetical protein
MLAKTYISRPGEKDSIIGHEDLTWWRTVEILKPEIMNKAEQENQ